MSKKGIGRAKEDGERGRGQALRFCSSVQAFRVAYEYDLTGALKKVTDPYSSEVSYTKDKIGRMTAVDGSAFGDNTTGHYASGIKYRAFGSTKEMTAKTDDDAVVSMQYDDRLRVSNYQVATSAISGGYLKKSSFAYNADSKPLSMTDTVNSAFGRNYKYDHMARLTFNNVSTSSTASGPYDQTITYDAFTQMTNRSTHYWSDYAGFTATYTQGRESTSGVGGGGGRGPRNTGPIANDIDVATFENCINTIFGGTIKNVSASYKRTADRASVSFDLVYPASGSPVTNASSVTFTTFFNRSSSQLASQMNAETGPKADKYASQAGYTSPNQRGFNWIASDVISNTKAYGDIGITALMVHETGNMIANLLNISGWANSHTDNSNYYGVTDNDIGQKLENCVFGGRVGLRSGRLGPEREIEW